MPLGASPGAFAFCALALAHGARSCAEGSALDGYPMAEGDAVRRTSWTHGMVCGTQSGIPGVCRSDARMRTVVTILAGVSTMKARSCIPFPHGQIRKTLRA